MPANTKLVSSSPAATCASQLSNREMLEGESDLLFCIAVEFYKLDHLYDLAMLLGVTKWNRKGYHLTDYVRHKAVEIGTRDNALIVREVLRDWIRERPREATKTNLYKVIAKIIPSVGGKFKSVLTSKLELKDQLTDQLYILSCEKRGPTCTCFL